MISLARPKPQGHRRLTAASTKGRRVPESLNKKVVASGHIIVRDREIRIVFN